MRLVLPDLTVDLLSDRGVFASRSIDPGTKLLLMEGPPPPLDGRPLIDLGCGSGAIAVALALRAPASAVWAVDLNSRARELTLVNAAEAGVDDRVRAVASIEEVEADLAGGVLYSNPPIRVGKDRLHGLVTTWFRRIAPRGSAHLVIHKNLGSDSLQHWLEDQGWATRRVVSRLGYRVLSVEVNA